MTATQRYSAQHRHPVSGARQPSIAADLARAVAGCRAAVDALATVGTWTLPDAVAAAAQALRHPSHQHPADVIGRALSLAAADHLHAVASDPASTPALARAARAAADVPATLPGVVAAAWQADPGPVADHKQAVADLVGQGVDGEALLWGLIGVESQHQVGLVWKEANRLAPVFLRDVEDLFGYGWMGLRTALANFDPARGYQFSTFAMQKINGAIRDGVRSEDVLPKRATTKRNKAQHVEEELTAALGRTPTLAEIARRMNDGTGAAELARMREAARLDEVVDESGMTLAEVVLGADGDAQPELATLGAVLRDDVERALARLPREEAVAVRLLVMENRSSQEVQQATGATAKQLRARVRRGQALLASELAAWSDYSVA